MIAIIIAAHVNKVNLGQDDYHHHGHCAYAHNNISLHSILCSIQLHSTPMWTGAYSHIKVGGRASRTIILSFTAVLPCHGHMALTAAAAAAQSLITCSDSACLHVHTGVQLGA